MDILNASKCCSRCGYAQPRSEFWRDASRPDGLHSQCKSCKNGVRKESRKRNPDWRDRDKERSRLYKINNPEKYRESIRNSTLKKKYGITSEDYDALLSRQDGKCAICGSTESGGYGPNLHVDHNHDTGEIRGILCKSCNTGLGFFQDDAEMLKAAIQYLEKSN